MDRAGRRLRGVNRAADSLGLSFGRLTAAIGVTAAAGGLIALTKRAIDAGDQVQKLSIRLGASTEALSQYRFVAERANISFQTLTTGMQRMTRRIGEAAQGSGEAKDAIAELNLSAVSLAKLPLDQQFEIIADRLAGLSNQSDRVRLAFKLFDAEGVSLLQTMEGGAAGIRALRTEADSLGLTITQDVADQMAKAKDETTKLNAAMAGLGQQMAITFGPSVTEGISTVTELLRTFLMGSGITRQATPGHGSPGVTPGTEARSMNITIPGGEILNSMHVEEWQRAMQERSEQFGDIEQQMSDIANRESRRRLKIAEFESTQIASMRADVVQQSIQLLSTLGAKSKVAAIAAIALNKALSIGQAIQNTAVAYTKALAIDPTGTLATRVAALGRIQIGIIAATGLAEIGNIGDRGASAGSAGGPPVQTAAQESPAASAGPRGVTHVQLVGNFYGFDDFEDRVVEAVRRADGRDVIVIDSRGRTAAEIRAAA